jgi:hypothetical protein
MRIARDPEILDCLLSPESGHNSLGNQTAQYLLYFEIQKVRRIRVSLCE